MEQHLAGCHECQDEMRWLRPAIERIAQGVDLVEPEPDLRMNVMEEVRKDVERSAPRRARPALLRGWRPVAAFATVALVVAAVAGYAVRDGETGGSPDTTTVVAGKAPGVTATMVSRGHSGTLRLENVRNMPPDRVLEAWVQREGTVEPVRALFVPDRHGRASTTIPDTDGCRNRDGHHGAARRQREPDLIADGDPGDAGVGAD